MRVCEAQLNVPAADLAAGLMREQGFACPCDPACPLRILGVIRQPSTEVRSKRPA